MEDIFEIFTHAAKRDSTSSWPILEIDCFVGYVEITKTAFTVTDKCT